MYQKSLSETKYKISIKPNTDDPRKNPAVPPIETIIKFKSKDNLVRKLNFTKKICQSENHFTLVSNQRIFFHDDQAADASQELVEWKKFDNET